MGTRRVPAFELEMTNSNGQNSSFKMSHSSFKGGDRMDKEEEMDAFYARMLKKENVNKKFKRERMIR